jgi:hypothetical protein
LAETRRRELLDFPPKTGKLKILCVPMRYLPFLCGGKKYTSRKYAEEIKKKAHDAT